MKKYEFVVNQENMAEELSINVGNLSESFTDQTAKYAYWSSLTIQAKNKVERKKLELEVKEDFVKKTLIGILDNRIRTRFKDEGVKATETLVVNTIYTEPDYRQAKEEIFKLKEELLDLQEEYSVLEGIREAFNQRKDMLISLGAHVSAEMINEGLHQKED